MAARSLPSLPVVGSQPPERADAARNRVKILEAAERLVRQHGIENVSMDMLAEEAGVGKGTIFRRFGDRATLARNLIDERERALQEGFIRGEPPLGPGAPAADRLRAFGAAMIELLEEHGDILLAAEKGQSHLVSAPYRAHHAHVASLIAELDPRLDAAFHADVLLTTLTARQYLYWRRVRGMPAADVSAGWDASVAALQALAAR